MRRYTLFAVALLSLAFLAARTDGFQWTVSRDLQQPVEQQTPGGQTQPDHSLWVTNPTDCAWDADDHIDLLGYGRRLAPGETVSQAACIIGDTTAHLGFLEVCVPSQRAGAVSAVLSLQMPGTAFENVTVPAGGTQLRGKWSCIYACFLGPDVDESSRYLTPVDGSNGGIGLPSAVQVSLTNQDRRAVDVAVKAGISFDYEAIENHYCPGGYPVRQNGICLPWVSLDDPRVCWSR